MSRRRLALVTVAVFLALLAADLARPPERQASAGLLVAGISAYRNALAPRLAAAGVRCRFRPTCSRYAEAVIRRDGALVGTARTARRLLACGPWTPAGTVDPP